MLDLLDYFVCDYACHLVFILISYKILYNFLEGRYVDDSVSIITFVNV